MLILIILRKERQCDRIMTLDQWVPGSSPGEETENEPLTMKI